MNTATLRAHPSDVLRDWVSLVKPRITGMVLFTAAGGYVLAPGHISWPVLVSLMLGLLLVVGGANSLNCYWERDTDALMSRTQDRPVAAGRMHPTNALVLGLGLGAAGLSVLSAATPAWTTILGLIAYVSYVAAYTPLKRVSSLSTVIGAIPGALPPLMGWTTQTATIDGPGMTLFGVLFLWQLPHFLAISLYRQSEYEAAGLKVLPTRAGYRGTISHMIRTTAFLIPVTLLLTPLGVTGWVYLVGALCAGSAFLLNIVWASQRLPVRDAARMIFLASLIYLTGLFILMTLDVTLFT